MTVRCIGSMVVALTTIGNGDVVAQSASDLVHSMLEAHEARIEGVENYTLVQAVMGFETETYFEKRTLDGRSVFQASFAGADGQRSSPATGVEDVYALGEDLARRSEYRGRERVGDYEVHVLDITDLRGTGFGSNVAQDSEFEPVRGSVFLDAESYVPRRLVFEGEMTRSGSAIPLTAIMEIGEYREVQGLLIPFRTVTTIEGLAAAIDPEVKAQFEQMQRELEELPAQQRAMIIELMAEPVSYTHLTLPTILRV